MPTFRRADLSLPHRLSAPSVPVRAPGRPPLLVLLHGIGSNELAMAGLAPALDPRLLILSVRAPRSLGPYAFEWFPMAFGPDGPIVEPGVAAPAWQRILAFTEDAIEAYGVDPERVVVGGFSQGGMVALGALLARPDRLAGAICLSGHLLPDAVAFAAEPDRLEGKPVLITHGTRDGTLPVALGRRAAAELRRRSLDVTWREFDLDHTTSDASLAVVADWLAARIDG